MKGAQNQSPSNTGKTETHVERQKHQSLLQAEATACTGPVTLFMLQARHGH